jgi:SHS2 domain-containing protein
MDPWEPLPPRRKKSRHSSSAVEEEECQMVAFKKGGSVDAEPPLKLDESKAAVTSQQIQAITDNVAKRSGMHRAKATLESRDGCAGEFYECMLSMFLNVIQLQCKNIVTSIAHEQLDLDHTADVQFHCWGKSLEDAFANMAPCMFNYMTDLQTVEIDPSLTEEFTVKGSLRPIPLCKMRGSYLPKVVLLNTFLPLCTAGHDMHSLLFAYMDELLFRFCTDGFCCLKVDIVSFDRNQFEITLRAHGESFDQTKHPQGTEVKAITYSNMQIHEADGRVDLFVIVDI